MGGKWIKDPSITQGRRVKERRDGRREGGREGGREGC